MIDQTIHVLTVPRADPWRDNNVAQLKAQTRVCEHADPDRKGLIRNWIGALECAKQSDQEWVAIVSDDAIPLRRWKTELAEAVRHCPTPVLGLTYFGDVPRRFARRPYLVGNGLVYGGAIAYRTEILEGLLTFAETFMSAGNVEDDLCVSLYLAHLEQRSALAVHAIFGQPSLYDSPSFINNACQMRKPTRTIEIHPRPDWDEGYFRYDRIADREVRVMATKSLTEKIGGAAA